jgi:lysophospholipase L1-like esterase
VPGPAGSPGSSTTASVSGPDIAAIGDSLMNGDGGAGISVPSVLQQLVDGRPHPGTVRNLSVAGETSITIAGRAGARPWQVRLPDDRVPASGTVPVTLVADSPGRPPRPLVLGQGVNPVTIAGVPGTLARRGEDDYTFTRSTPGPAVDLVGQTHVVTEQLRARRGDLTLMWWGSNDTPQELAGLVSREQATAEALSAGDDRWLVLGIISGERSYRADLEADMVAAFGHRFLNTRELLSSTAALRAARITPTDADTRAIAIGEVPPSLKADEWHLTAAGYTIVANAVWARLLELGWDDVWR